MTPGLMRSIWLFVLAGVCEIGGGWLMWKWLRDGRPSCWGLDGDRPDAADVIGATIALVGVCLMYYWPREVGATSHGPLGLQ